MTLDESHRPFAASGFRDTTRIAAERGTLGEEIYKVFCQRIASTEYPTDVRGDTTRAFCEGREEPNESTPPRLRALSENRARLVTALDSTLPGMTTCVTATWCA